ncbi:MAG TPA: hypothetical protein VFB12_16420 [Ktedonobacteraceae bacterium]|nr:hypothetical protein [Ktedonobacteraceae bacterium]
MTTLPLADGARLLGVHPKTLCSWFKQAHLPLTAHPADARIKCVSTDHLQQVAGWHGRLFPPAPLADATSPSLPASEPRRRSLPTSEGEPASCACSLSASSPSEADLIQKLSCLETKVMTLQEQLAQLALALLQERERVVEQRITALESLMHQLVGKLMPDPPTPEVQQEPACAPREVRQLLPAEQLARSRMPPLIEYSKQGTYVIVSSQEGELHLVPDSAQWFDWLATISSFRFVGPAGRFTACREGRGSRGWIAHRSVHQQRYKRYLGVTDRLTIASLEQTAATLLTPAASP